MSGIFTPPGTNAANAQNANNANLQNFGMDFVNKLKPYVDQQLNFSKGLEPARENAVNTSLQLLSPGNQQAQANKAIGQIHSNLAGTDADLANAIRSQGGSAGAVTGAVADAGNNAANQSNQITTQLNDPAHMAMLQQMVMQIISGGSQMSSLQPLATGAAIVQGAPQVQVGPGFADFAGNLAGQWASGGFKH